MSIISPVVGQPHLALDLVQHFAADASLSTVFTNGIADASNTDEGRIYLLPFYMEDKPANCAVIRTVDQSPNGENPVRRAGVTVSFRMPKDSTNSAQKRAEAAAEALLQWLRPDGHQQTYQTLPSGRLVRKWSNAMTAPFGEDGSKRFITNLTFDIFYVDINVP